MTDDLPQLEPIGHVESPLADTSTAPKQGEEGTPDAWLVFDERVEAGLEGLVPGCEVVVVTWLHLGRRDVLRVHPRGDPDRPQRGVFTTRSPSRPNPIGLHRVEVVGVEGLRVRVRNLEAVDGTPVIDVKSVQPGRFDD